MEEQQRKTKTELRYK